MTNTTETHKTEPTSNSNAAPLKPGKLDTQVSIVLNTYDSQSLFTGNRKASVSA